MIYGYFRTHTQQQALALSFESNCDVCLITSQFWRLLQADDVLVIEDIFQLIKNPEELPNLLLAFYHQRIEFRCLNQPWLNLKQTTPVYLINDVITGINRLQRYRPNTRKHFHIDRSSQVKKTHVKPNFHYYFELERLNPNHNHYAVLPPILAEATLTICLDESGSLGFDQNRYFVLGGVVTYRLHTAIQRYAKLEEREKVHNRHGRNQELKSTHLSKHTREKFMDTLLADELLTPICVVVDKQNPEFQLGKKREYYNFLVKTLIQKACTYRLVPPHAHINLRIDQQSLPIESVNSLVEYLNSELRYDEKEQCSIDEITVDYLDSAKHADIRIADFIVGVVRANIEHEHREIKNSRLNQRLIRYYL